MGRRLSLLTEDVEHLKEELSKLKRSDHFTFGDYHGEIEWRVLKRKPNSNYMLVISEYALDVKPFDEGGKTNDWDKCSLKKWLNSDFFNQAFNSEEKSLIENIHWWGKVFLLDGFDAEQYFKRNSNRKCKPTQYALSQGAATQQGFAYWWLSSRGMEDAFSVENVGPSGDIDDDGLDVINTHISVRPAMWLKI